MDTRELYIEDIKKAIEAWKLVFAEYDVDYMYVKGSAIKPIETHLDYVPILSDLDIHFKINGEFLQTGIEGLMQGLRLSESYLENFKRIHPNALHTPRPQLMEKKKTDTIENFILSDLDKVEFIIGDKNKITQHRTTDKEIKQIDRNNLLKEEEFLLTMSNSIYDRVDLDNWNYLRRLNYRISPSIARLLSQLEADSFELWSQNRTRYIKLLEYNGYKELASHFSEYYRIGWNLYHTNFKNNQLYKKIFLLGFQIIEKAISSVKAIRSNL